MLLLLLLLVVVMMMMMMMMTMMGGMMATVVVLGLDGSVQVVLITVFIVLVSIDLVIVVLFIVVDLVIVLGVVVDDDGLVDGRRTIISTHLDLLRVGPNRSGSLGWFDPGSNLIARRITDTDTFLDLVTLACPAGTFPSTQTEDLFVGQT